MEISPTTSTTQGSTAEASRTKLTGDLKSFLTLLTTQLKHQDPLEPVDSTEFTSQLAQFAAVEQGINTNANLEKLIALSTANQSLSAVTYLGKFAEAHGNAAALVNGSATLAYELPQNVEAAAIAIQNEAGVTVAVRPAETTAGHHSFTWDGLDSQGLQLPDGKYTFAVNAIDKDGNSIAAKTFTVGVVDGADSSGDTVKITINGVPVNFSDVVSIKLPPSQT